MLSDIGKVGSLSGAFFGSAMMFVFPPIMYIRALQLDSVDSSAIEGEKRRRRGERKVKIAINIALLLSGISLGLLGTFNTVVSILSK